MKSLYILISFILLFLSLSIKADLFTPSASVVNFYLDSNSTCVTNCGSLISPFNNFKDAIRSISSQRFDSGVSPILNVQSGDYFGILNKGIEINIDMSIISTKGSDVTFIDCQNAGYGFKVSGDVTFSLIGFTIQRCNAGRGAALYTTNLITTLEDVVFLENSAREGAAIYTTSKVFNMDSTNFYKQRGGHSVVMIGSSSDIINTKFNLNDNDIYCENGNIITTDSIFGSICSDCNILNQDNESIDICGGRKENNECNFDGVCQKWVENGVNCPSDCSKNSDHVCNKDGICDPSGESFDNCPDDCDPLQQPGWKVDYYAMALKKPPYSSPLYYEEYNELRVDSRFIPFPQIKGYMAKFYAPVSGRMVSQVTANRDGFYFFKLDTANIDAVVFVNGRVAFDTYLPENSPSFVNERKLLMAKDVASDIEIVFISRSDNQRDIALQWRHESESEYRPIPSFYINQVTSYNCGDGVCNDQTPDSCMIDCHSLIEKICPAQSPPAKLQDFYQEPHKKDTLGTLLNNQYIFSQPGVHYMSHGIDIATGVARPSPIFDLTYCDNTSFTIVQDPYRSLVYSVPPGLHAQIAPKCTMDFTTKSYANSAQMAREQSLTKGISASASASANYFVSLSASASLSKSDSVQTASKMETSEDGSLSVTELNCETSKIHLVDHRFSPKFIQDLSNTYIDGNPIQSDKNMKNIIKKYGSLYYKSAVMGGKIEVITIVKNSFSSTQNSKSISKALDMSVSAQASYKVFSASASTTSSIDSKTDAIEQEEFEKNSERSKAHIIGGEPGSYGLNEPNAFATWAKTVDMVPHPIDYQVGYISDLIPESWFFKGLHSIKNAWLRNEIQLYKEISDAKRLKYINVLTTLSDIQRTDTTYLVSFNLGISKLSVTFVDSKGRVLAYPEAKFLNAADHNLLTLEHPDNFGIASIEFGTSIASLPASFTLYNIFTSRYYQFNRDGTTLRYNIVKQNPLDIVLDFQGLQYAVTRVICELTIVGVHSSYSSSISMSQPLSSPTKSFTISASPVGKILGISLDFITDPSITSNNNDVYVRFTNLIIRQNCPEELSDCVPQKTAFNPDEGYVNAYELWKLPITTPPTNYFSYNFNQTNPSPKFFPIDYFGK
ncbi:hypothetical protein CYY_000126 [Polysphondylium violaceum]|uniref:PA14 domain-containing protein n=1 Tax=Polysphondylium violaceum TaxID=133409 RepID=A0A8J4QBQ7_9MYCE|nr:hypothetical protein CYY_000126 [Polysphondylium violaceum]